jgi:hypothetical protein
MGGFIFRLGVCLKDLGERIKWNRLIRLGLAVREAALRYGKVK